ncbi:hypothetical protein T03_12917 [Trichinella britovi]|uniref:Uncharacterized protein n=1 Tax=Trichinella britovi TaxID=45882 RepID=A0A0V1D071_TRIBR|nr:hypothetical protein T03_12917 [Trichinella britovi]
MVGLLDWRRRLAPRLEAEKEDVAPREAIRSKLLPLTPTLRHTHTHTPATSASNRHHAKHAHMRTKPPTSANSKINCLWKSTYVYRIPRQPSQKICKRKKSLLRQSCLTMTLYGKQASGRKCSPTKTEA